MCFVGWLESHEGRECSPDLRCCIYYSVAWLIKPGGLWLLVIGYSINLSIIIFMIFCFLLLFCYLTSKCSLFVFVTKHKCQIDFLYIFFVALFTIFGLLTALSKHINGIYITWQADRDVTYLMLLLKKLVQRLLWGPILNVSVL